jgi:feruloyl esterase
MRLVIAVVSVLSLAAALHGQGLRAIVVCDTLAESVKLTNATVTSIDAITTGTFTPPAIAGRAAAAETGLPSVCRVSLTLAPTPDSDIKTEVWLPMSGWNGKLQAVGNGGWGGSIQYAALAAAVKRGYAAASTDTGHVGDTARFALGHPDKLLDFGYRAIHETAVQSKATIAAAYGTAPRLSYFNGCSGGGRQAFMEAQRYPQDFDAIIAGAPGYNRTDQSFQLIAASKATHLDAASFIPPAKLQVLHTAAIQACDAGDGLADGLIGNPLACRFDPDVTACKAGDATDCLTRSQVEAAKKIYAPIVDPKNGAPVFPGVVPGSEPRWTVNAGGPRPLGMSDELFKFVVFKDPDWDFRTLDLGQHLEIARAAAAATVDATSPDITAFVSRGGKLLIYHGWGDTNVPPASSVNYYNRVVETLGEKQASASVRLFMAPGMGHCGGGEGPNVFDTVTALEQWREQGKAPDAIEASLIADGRVVRTRPLCPYPQIATYKGSGSIDRADNFTCRVPR